MKVVADSCVEGGPTGPVKGVVDSCVEGGPSERYENEERTLLEKMRSETVRRHRQ